MEYSHKPEPRLAAVKLLAIIGFLAMLALIVWLAVQGLRAFPNTFSSLASIAESIQGYQTRETLEITLEKNIVNSGETFKIMWTDMRGNGTYHFSYTCADGVSLSVRSDVGLMREISCTEDLELPKEATGLFVSATSKAQRFSDLTFSVRFDAAKGDDSIIENRVTVVNATVPTKAESAVVNATTTPSESEVAVTPKPTPVVTTRPVTPPVVTKPAPSVPVQNTQPATAIVSLIPQSDPNGFVDLKMSFGAVGTMNGTTFTPAATYDTDVRAGLRFEVKNIGTKRSDTWTYRIELPEGVYESDIQLPLEPNERALFTIGFDISDSTKNSVVLKGSVTEKHDTNSKNDSFSWSVKVTE